MIIIKRKELLLMEIIYFRLDFPNLVQSYVWQTEDVIPEIPRIHKFLNYWYENIGATIKEINISGTDKPLHISHTQLYKDFN